MQLLANLCRDLPRRFIGRISNDGPIGEERFRQLPDRFVHQRAGKLVFVVKANHFARLLLIDRDGVARTIGADDAITAKLVGLIPLVRDRWQLSRFRRRETQERSSRIWKTSLDEEFLVLVSKRQSFQGFLAKPYQGVFLSPASDELFGCEHTSTSLVLQN